MKLIDKDALVAEIEKLIDEIYAGRPFDSLSSEQQTALWYVKSIMSSVNILEVKEWKEEPVSGLDNGDMPVERWKQAVKAASNQRSYRSSKGLTETRDDYFVDGVQWADEHPKEEPVSKELEEASRNYADNEEYGNDVYFAIKAAFKAGAQWKKGNFWKSADGDDLPEYDREVVVLIKYNTQRNIHDEEYPTYRVGFGHRPNPNGWDGKNIDTNEVTHYTPKLYGKGGWNAPDIVYWLDCSMPKEIEL